MKQFLLLSFSIVLISCNSDDENNLAEPVFNIQIEDIYAISQHRVFAYVSSENLDIIYQIKLTSTDEERWFDANVEIPNELCGLEPSTTYEATLYGVLEESLIEGNSIVFKTDAVGIDMETEIIEVSNPITGKIWMDRNLGAERAAISTNDSRAFGDLYQWGRRADGHEKRDSEIIEAQTDKIQPNHSDFIIGSPVWHTEQNANLWNGIDAVNNPCPCGFRLPTPEELANEISSWSNNNAQGAISSVLKLPLPGYRGNVDGLVMSENLFGYYWSSETQNTNGKDIGINHNSAQNSSHAQAGGASIRCIKDE